VELNSITPGAVLFRSPCSH